MIGNETRAQMQEIEGRLPDLVVACVGGGSNAIGMFHPFLDDTDVAIHGVEAAGEGVDTTASCRHDDQGHARRAAWRALLSVAGQGRPGSRSPFDFGRSRLSRRRAGTFLAAAITGRVKYFSATDKDALEAFQLLSQARRHHSGARIRACASPMSCAMAPKMDKDQIIVVALSGRGDKDVFSVAAALGAKL